MFDLSVTSPPAECARNLIKSDFNSGKVNNPYNDDLSIELDLDLFNIIMFSMAKAGFLCHEAEFSKEELLTIHRMVAKRSRYFSPQ